MYEFEDRVAVVARMQTDLLTMVHRTALDVVAARKRLEERVEELEEGRRHIVDSHAAAVAAGEQQAELLEAQAARAQEHITELRTDLDRLRGAEELLASRAQQMQDQIASFRNAMALISAQVAAARTSAVAGEALDTLRDALTYVEYVVTESIRPRPERPKAPRGTAKSTAGTPPHTSLPDKPAPAA
jgi:chromosome segregation ATPase